MDLNGKFYDSLGKQLFTDLLKQLKCPYTLTKYEYDKVDIYFGRSSVAEIKYRLKPYPTYIIEENKVEALSSIPCSNQYYVTVLDKDIFIWSLPTIRNYPPQYKRLPINLDKTEYTLKQVRYLPTQEADYHFQLQDKKWQLIKLS